VYNGPIGGDFAQCLKNISRSACFAVDKQIYVRHSITATLGKRSADCGAEAARVL
jgi:hypothetical protein